MQDLFDVQMKHMDTLLKGPERIQEEDLVTRAVLEISKVAGQIMSDFQAQRFSEAKIDPTKLKTLIFSATEWVTALFYCLEIDPPDFEEVSDFANQFESEVAADVILASFHMQGSIADFALGYFCEDSKAAIEELDNYLGEVLACLELISRRLETTLSKLIMNI
jgi:hypothetical protein